MRKCTALFFSVLLLLCMTACGKKQEMKTDNPLGLVYVPEYLELGDEGNSFLLYDVLLDGDTFCHPVLSGEEITGASQIVMHRHSLADGTLTESPLKDGAAGISSWTLGVDGSMYFVLYGWSLADAGEKNSTGTVLVEYGKTGDMVFSRDITELIDENNLYLKIATDGQGRIYLLTESRILLFDGKGNPQGTVNLAFSDSTYFSSFSRAGDGKVYISGTLSNGTGGGSSLYEVNFETGKLGAGLANFPSGGGSLSQDAVGNIVTYDYTAVYTYDMKSQKAEQLLVWTDSGIEGTTVSTVGVLSDGRIAVFYRDWQNSASGLALLSGVELAEVSPKQEILLAQLYPSTDIQSAVTLFNGKSDLYHITVKNYLNDYGASQEEIDAAITRLVADIVAGNSPDLLNPSGLYNEIEHLVSIGAFEDLNPYLEQSSVLEREDMVESVLNAETHDGILISIPSSFDIYAYFGSTAKVGEEMGWTYKDVMTLLKNNPGSVLDDGISRMRTLFFCLDINDYVDWETGTCSFDSGEFKNLLKFVAELSMPEGNDLYSFEWLSVMEKLQSGEVLLLHTGISRFEDIQVVQGRFQGAVTAIGEPTSDGSAKCSMLVQNTVAMLSQSKAKEGAWAFIEYYLMEGDDKYRYGFPNSWRKLEEMIAEATEYERDEDGNPVLDENGDLIPSHRMSYEFGGYWYETHVPTQKEIDQVLDIIRAGKTMNVPAGESILRQIVREEAEAFFKGQRSVDDVAQNIQRRAAIYVSENY